MKKTERTGHPAEQLDSQVALEEDISIHIFDTSATMVGVCLTVIGLFRIVLQLKSISTWADDLLSIDAMLFLGACGLAYWALRKRNLGRRRRTERVADVIFLVALSLMTTTCALITYAFV